MRRICCASFLAGLAPLGTAQAQAPPPASRRSLLPQESFSAATAPTAPAQRLEAAKRRDRRRFILLSAAVYGLAFLDMHETASLGPGVVEHDPLARPFIRLPTPAYYACGAAMATGVNWLAWKMGRSQRWRRIRWLPQTASMAGNIWGYASTKARE